MNNIARPRLMIEVKDAKNHESAPNTGGKSSKKPSDSRIQKLNTVLGPRGIRADELLKKFDILSEKYKPNTPIPVYLNIIVDNKGRSIEYSMRLGTPPLSYIVKQKLGVEKLSKTPNNKDAIRIIDDQFIEDILIEKYSESINKMPTLEKSRLIKCTIGSLKSFGIHYKTK